jgi:hypothetical protein
MGGAGDHLDSPPRGGNLFFGQQLEALSRLLYISGSFGIMD